MRHRAEQADVDRFLRALGRRLSYPIRLYLVGGSAIVGRSPYVRSYGNLHVYYFDLASSIISKAARGAERDLTEIEALVRAGLVQWNDVEARWKEIRSSQVSWLRHDPQQIEQRLTILGERFLVASASPDTSPAASPLPPEDAKIDPESVDTGDRILIQAYRRRDGKIVPAYWRRKKDPQ